MRHAIAAVLALGFSLAAACRREPKPADEPATSVTLEAPAPSSTLVTSPLSAADTSYTNEMQAENLRAQAEEMGISRLGKPSSPDSGFDDIRPTISAAEGRARARELARQFEAQRLELERPRREKIVRIQNGTTKLLPGPALGRPIEPKDGL